MEDKVLKNIWEYLSVEGKTSNDFETWYKNVSQDEEAQVNIHSYLLEQKKTDSNLEQWLANTGIKKKEEDQETLSSKYIPKFISTGNSFTDGIINNFSLPLIGFFSENIEQGVARGQTSDEALAIMASASDATQEQIEEYVESIRSLEKYKPSEAMIRFNERYEEEGADIPAFLSAFAQNPKIGAEVLVQSISGAASTAVTKEGAALAGVGAAAGAATGAAFGPLGVGTSALYGTMAAANGAMEVASSLTEFINEDFQERNIEFNAENVRELISDKDRFQKIRSKALVRGGIISAVDLATMGITGKAVAGIGKASRMSGRLTKTAQATTGIGLEGAGGSFGEFSARAATGQEMSVADIGLEGIPGLSTAPITIGRAMAQTKYKIGDDEVDRSDVVREMKENPEIFIDKSITIENDESLSDEVNKVVEREKIKRDLEGIMPVENMEQAIDLEIERKKLLKSDKYTSKRRVSDIENELEKLRTPQTEEEVQEDVAPVQDENIQEQEVEAYKLPEDPKEAKKDFEVIDNRGGKEGLEIEEDGSGRWVVRNKKTGKLVNSKTKKDAEFLAKPENAKSNWDYGEGDPVIEESVDPNQTIKLTDSIKEVARAVRQKKKDLNQARKELSANISSFVKSGKINIRTANALQKKISLVNLENPLSVAKVVKYSEKVFEKADNEKKIADANSTRKKIKKLNKKGKTEATVYDQALEFLKIDTNLVTDIDEYNRISEMVRKGLTPTKLTKTGVRVSEDVNLSELKEYTDKEVASQKEIIDQAFKEIYQDATGDLSESLSFEEMQEVLNDEEYIPPSSEEKQKLQRDALVKAYDTYISLVKEIVDFGRDPFTGEDVDVTDQTKETIRSLYDVDLSRYDIREAIKILDGLKNFATNLSTGGIRRVAEINKGDINAKKNSESGFKANKIRLFSSSFIGRFYGKNIFNLKILTEFMFIGGSGSRKFFKDSGLNEVEKGKSDAKKSSKDLQEKYTNKFLKRKANNRSFDDEYNSIERYQLAFMLRTVEGSEADQAAEFQRRKTILREDFEYKINQGGVKAKEGELAKEVYDKIIKDSTSPSEVLSKADSTNKEAVDFWIQSWSDIFSDLSDVSLNIYNKTLVKDKNYTPDKFKKENDAEEVYEIDDLIKKQSYSDPANKVYDKESKTLIETKRPKSLKATGMIIDYNFDNGNIRAYENALVDINTADGISQLYGYINSNSFSNIVTDTEDANLLKRRIVSFVKKTRGVDNDIAQQNGPVMKFINRLASVGVVRALGGVVQPLKQILPPLINTFINAKFNLSISSYFRDKGVEDFIDKASRSIALRGVESTTNIESPSSKFDYQMKSTKVGQVSKSAGKGIEKITNLGLKYLVQNPDRFAARLSFYTYYRQYLKDQGFNVSNIDWSNHKVNDEAADYAVQQVDRQQNVSDVDMQGDLYSSKKTGYALFRKIVIPFTNFAMNQKSRMYSDTNTLFFQKGASKSDKNTAMRSLSGLAAETIAFNAISYYASSVLYASVMSLMGKDDSEEDKEERYKKALRGRLTNITNDVFSPFSGVTDYYVVQGVNSMLNFMSENEEEAFQLYSQDKKSFIEQLGLLGIGQKTIADSVEIIDMIYSGSYKNNFGKEVKITEEAKDVLITAFGVQLMYAAGIAPAEAGAMVRYAVKEVKKMKVKKASKPLFKN